MGDIRMSEVISGPGHQTCKARGALDLITPQNWKGGVKRLSFILHKQEGLGDKAYLIVGSKCWNNIDILSLGSHRAQISKQPETQVGSHVFNTVGTC